MQISLPEHQEAFVSQQAKAAGYRSADEWVQELIFDRMIEANPQYKAELDASLERGLRQAEAGEGIPSNEYFDSLRERLRRKYSKNA